MEYTHPTLTQRFIALVATVLVLLAPGSALGYDWGAAYNSSNYSSQYFSTDDSCVVTIGDNNLTTGGCCGSAVAPPTSGAGAGGTNDNEKTAWDFFIGKGLAPFRVAGIMGNLMQESHVNPSDPNPAAKNGGGGIAQWEGDRWSGTNGLEAFAKSKGTPWDNLNTQLEFMWKEMTTTHSNALSALKSATNVKDATDQFEEKFEGAGNPQMQNREQFARDALASPKMGNGAPSSGAADATATPTTGGTAPVGTAACALNGDVSGGAANGDIVKTAMGYAWPTPNCDGPGQRDCHVPMPNYKQDNVNKGGDDAFTDCGTFVATVMIMSKVDPNYPHVGTGEDQAYVKSSSKYRTFKPTNTSQLAPGDILVFHNGSEGHTMIYVGKQGGAYPRVDASWHDHTPQMGKADGPAWMFQQPGVTAAHFITPTSP